MKIKGFVIVLALIIFAGVFNGCGYTTHLSLPSGVKSVYIPNFKNSIPQSDRYSYEAGIEIDVTNAVIDRFLFDGNLKVEKEEVAEAILKGEVTGYRQETVRFNSIEGVEQYRLFIVVKLSFVNQKTGEVIWEEGSFSGDTEYFISGANATSESAAVDDAIVDLAKKVVNRVVEDW